MLDRDRYTLEELNKMIVELCNDYGIDVAPEALNGLLSHEEQCMMYEDLEYWVNNAKDVKGTLQSVLEDYYQEV